MEPDIYAVQWDGDSTVDYEFCFRSREEAESFLEDAKRRGACGVVVPLHRHPERDGNHWKMTGEEWRRCVRAMSVRSVE